MRERTGSFINKWRIVKGERFILYTHTFRIVKLFRIIRFGALHGPIRSPV